MPLSSKHSAPPPAAKSSSINWRSVSWRSWCLIGGLAMAPIFFGIYLSRLRVDDKAVLDRQIEEGWMRGREIVDALEFFEKGGVYESREVEKLPEISRIDQEHVVPLIKQLQDRHQLRVLVIIKELPPELKHLADKLPKSAMAVIAEAPADRVSRNEVRATILEMTEDFPGLATQNWSHNWVSLDFFDEEEASVFHKSGAFDRLKESQRRME